MHSQHAGMPRNGSLGRSAGGSPAGCGCMRGRAGRRPVLSTSLAPPCAGPQSAATPEATHAKGLAWLEPAVRTVDVLAFCSWSMCLHALLEGVGTPLCTAPT